MKSQSNWSQREFSTDSNIARSSSQVHIQQTLACKLVWCNTNSSPFHSSYCLKSICLWHLASDCCNDWKLYRFCPLCELSWISFYPFHMFVASLLLFSILLLSFLQLISKSIHRKLFYVLVPLILVRYKVKMSFPLFCTQFFNKPFC